MKIPERGIKYKASPRAYIANYLIAAGLVFVAVVVIRRFEISFFMPPATLGELGSTLVYAIFFGAAAWLAAEPLVEGLLRHYLISRSEVVKVEGLVSKRRHSIPYQSVSESRVTKGIFGRIFNYGTIEISSMNEGGISMRHVSDPDEIHRIVQHRVNSVRSALGKRARKQDSE